MNKRIIINVSKYFKKAASGEKLKIVLSRDSRGRQCYFFHFKNNDIQKSLIKLLIEKLRVAK